MDRRIVELLVSGTSVRDIRKQLRVGSGRLEKVRALALAHGYLGGGVALPPFPVLLFPDRIDHRADRGSAPDEALKFYENWIRERLTAGWRPITIYEEIGINVTRSSFYRFLSRQGILRLGEHNRRVVPEIIHKPGSALLLDWGKLRDFEDPVTGRKKPVWAFVGTLGCSRYLMVRLVFSNDLRTTISAIESMFGEMGGVPERLISDNPKCFAIEACRYEPILNPGLELFLAHYGVTMECLPPRDPKKKGKVERMMPYIRRLYEAHGSEWLGIEESEAYLNKKLELANLRIHGTTRKKPVEEFMEIELNHLKSLPSLAYEPQEYAEAKVRKDGHVRFQNKYYSVEEKFIDQDVFIIGSQTQVAIYHDGKLVETHRKITESFLSKSTKSHHLKPWEQAMQDDSHYLKRAAKLGPDVERLVLILLRQGEGFIDTRKIWGILSLDKKYQPQRINEAARLAIECETPGYRAVVALLKLQSNSARITEEKPRGNTTNNKFVRSLSHYQEALTMLQ